MSTEAGRPHKPLLVGYDVTPVHAGEGQTALMIKDLSVTHTGFVIMNQPPIRPDARLAALHDWACAVLNVAALELAHASSDASFRRYFRVRGLPAHLGQTSLIAMDAPPPQEDCRPFVQVAGLLAEAGLHVPAILQADLEQGFMLLADLGSQTYLDVLNDANADELMQGALDALIIWQKTSRPGILPDYDRAMLQRELALFPEWYVERHLGQTLTAAERAVWQASCELLITSALAQTAVFVHRDYMPRNLMLCPPNPAIIDFQGAAYGAISYDVASLFRDAFMSWKPEKIEQWTHYYFERGQAAGLNLPDDFQEFRRAMDWMGLQRHLKVLGIFARINYRDGKPHYLGDTPRFVRYIREVASRYPQLAPLVALVNAIQQRAGLDS